MATPSPTVQKARSLLEDRRDELQAELKQIEQALSNLGAAPARKRGPGRPRKSSGSKPGKQRRSRQGGTRSEHALKLISKTPGLSAAEIADSLGIKPNYVYRVMGELVDDGKVEKRGKGFFPAAGAANGADPAEAPAEESSAKS